MKDGRTAEAGIVGNNGFTGTPRGCWLEQEPRFKRWYKSRGTGFELGRSFGKHIGIHSAPSIDVEPLRGNSEYAGRTNSRVQSAAQCQQRLARWLLMTQDRVDSGSLPITHDFLATMLGTDRPSVTLAAGVLQKKGIIEYTRGAVKVVNRKKLETVACECYAVIREYDGMIGVQ